MKRQRYSGYTHYKPSKIAWVGDIPSDQWEILPLRTVAAENILKNDPSKNENVLSLSYGKIIQRNIDLNFGLLPESFESYQSLNSGDIVLRLTDLQNDHESLRVGLVKQAGMITSAYLGLRVNRKKLDSRYLYYLLHTYDTAKVFYGMGGGVRQSIGYEALKYLPILVPSINTQEKISNFLEDRTRILDKTLELINLQINKLNEYRAALITRNISKKFPVKKLKYIADINQKTLPENTDPDFEFEYVDIGNIDGTGKIQPPQLYRFADAPSRARRLAEEGDVVISTVRTYLKAIAKITHKNRPRVFSTGFAVLHPRQINGDYLFWALQSEDFLAEVMANSIGVNYPGIGEYRLGSLPIAVPSRSRQTAIAKLLDERCGKINRSVEIFQSQRQLVESYRSSLINAAVTGKIKI